MQEPAARCYDQAVIWKALRSGAPLDSLRLNHPLSEYEAQPELLARLAGLDHLAAWDWLVREHNAARGQRQISDYLRQPGGEGQRRAAGRVVAGSSGQQLPPATAAAADTAACARGAPGVFYARSGQQPGALPFLLRVPPPSGGGSGSLRAHSQETGIEMGRFFAKRDAQAAYDLCLCRQVALDEATEERAREALLLPSTSAAWLADEETMERLSLMIGDAAMRRNLVGKDGKPAGLLKELLGGPQRAGKRRRGAAAARGGSRGGEQPAVGGASAAAAAAEAGEAALIDLAAEGVEQQQQQEEAQQAQQQQQQQAQLEQRQQQQQQEQAAISAGTPLDAEPGAMDGGAAAAAAAQPAPEAEPAAASPSVAAAGQAAAPPTAGGEAAGAAAAPHIAPVAPAAAAAASSRSEPATIADLNSLLAWCLEAGGLAADEADCYRFFFFRVLLPAERATDYAAMRAYQQRGDVRAAAFCVRRALAAAEAQELGRQ